MEIVLYNNYYEFHFRAGLKVARLADFLNALPLGFKFRLGPGDIYYDPERGPGVFSLHLKAQPREEVPIPSQEANYYIRWSARASEGDLPRMALRLSRDLSRELETRVWLVDGYGRILREDGSDSGYQEELSA